MDSMVKEGLLISETDFRQQEVISVAHPALFRKWPRVREWLTEDQEFLRMRDRVDGCLKLWLKRGRRTHDLLTPGLGLADGETLLNHFHSSLSNAQIEYIQKSLADQKRGRRVRYLFWLPSSLFWFHWLHSLEFRWFNNESLRTSMQEFGSVERRFAELVKTDRGGSQAELQQAEEKAQVAQHDAELAAAQRSAMESQLKQAQENANLALARQSAFETQLKQTQDKLQQAQQNADLVSSQRAALETQLKQAQDKLQQASRTLIWPPASALPWRLSLSKPRISSSRRSRTRIGLQPARCFGSPAQASAGQAAAGAAERGFGLQPACRFGNSA